MYDTSDTRRIRVYSSDIEVLVDALSTYRERVRHNEFDRNADPGAEIRDFATTLADSFIDRAAGDRDLVFMTFHGTNENHLTEVPADEIDSLLQTLQECELDCRAYRDLEKAAQSWTHDHQIK